MDIKACYLLGHITKTHGLKGEVSVLLDADTPENYQNLESVWVEQHIGQLVPFFIQRLALGSKLATIKFDEVDHLEQAQELVGKKLFLPLNVLPPLEGNNFYYHEVVGFNVHDRNHGTLGSVLRIYEGAGQDLISMDYQSKEVLIPINDAIVLSIDRELQLLEVELPQGLLEIYIEEL